MVYLGGTTIWNKNSKGFVIEILPWTPLQTPSTPDKCSSLTTKSMMLKFGKNLLNLLKKIVLSLTQI